MREDLQKLRQLQAGCPYAFGGSLDSALRCQKRTGILSASTIGPCLRFLDTFMVVVCHRRPC